MIRPSLLPLVALVASSLAAQLLDLDRLRAVPSTLAEGRLRVASVYRAQAHALAEADRPHAEFWAGDLGDEAAFRAWPRGDLLSDSLALARVGAVLGADLTGAFERGGAWVEATTGHAPGGTWTLVYGPGWTDMGGLGGAAMVADLSKLALEARLPHVVVHELVHQVRGAALDRVASRSQSILGSGVGAPGYFLGFRIVQAYETARGPGSWGQRIGLSVREALCRSGYPSLHS